MGHYYCIAVNLKYMVQNLDAKALKNLLHAYVHDQVLQTRCSSQMYNSLGANVEEIMLGLVGARVNYMAE